MNLSGFIQWNPIDIVIVSLGGIAVLVFLTFQLIKFFKTKKKGKSNGEKEEEIDYE